jgi:Protein of unknown function (DUF1194)
LCYDVAVCPRPIVLLVLFLLTIPAGGVIAQQPVDVELVLAADGSPSIDDQELRLQREGYAAAITDPSVLRVITGGYSGAIAVAFVEWGGPLSQETIVDWHLIRDQASARVFADKLLAAPRMAIGYNSISGAIDHAAALIADNAYDGVRKIIDISGDGPQIGGRPVAFSRMEALTAGITINALVVKSPGGGYPGPSGEPLEDHYANDIIGGPGSFVMIADEKLSFADAILNKLLREVAGGPASTVANR